MTARKGFAKAKYWQALLVALMMMSLFAGLDSARADNSPAATLQLDPNMQKTWERTDALVAQGSVSRSWLWGPSNFFIATEDYRESPGGKRLVAYFDKSRMEINNPDGDRSVKWFVTNGLLVKELISGRRALGNIDTLAYLPADNIRVAGDPDNVNPSPTYASFITVASLLPGQNTAADQTGQTVLQTIDNKGRVGANLTLGYNVKNVYYDNTLGHNIPDVFWTFMNSTGTVLENGKSVQGPVVDWTFSTGLPLADAYWTRAKVAGVEQDVLVQPFERRILTYTPSNPNGFKVEMGNVGRHYYEWRYNTPLPNCETAPIRGFGKVWGNNPSVRARIGCPYYYQTEQGSKTSILSFEHGKMIFVDTTATPGYYPQDRLIYVLFDDGTYSSFKDGWDASQPVDSGLTPPPGLYEPKRGFGKVWREGTGLRVRERLGWATEPNDHPGGGAVQNFQRGVMHWFEGTSQIVVLYRYYYDATKDIWEIYDDKFKD